jgi:hypothetical protein
MKCRWPQRADNAPKGVCARDAVGHLQKAGKPVPSVLRKLLDILPPVRAADHTHQRHHDDGQQRMVDPAGHPWIAKRREVLSNLQI